MFAFFSFNRNDNGDEIQNQSNHPILIFDRDLQKRAEDIIKRGERVIVYGQIQYRIETDQDGARTNSASIRAYKILTIKRANSYQNY